MNSIFDPDPGRPKRGQSLTKAQLYRDTKASPPKILYPKRGLNAPNIHPLEVQRTPVRISQTPWFNRRTDAPTKLAKVSPKWYDGRENITGPSGVRRALYELSPNQRYNARLQALAKDPLPYAKRVLFGEAPVRLNQFSSTQNLFEGNAPNGFRPSQPFSGPNLGGVRFANALGNITAIAQGAQITAELVEAIQQGAEECGGYSNLWAYLKKEAAGRGGWTKAIISDVSQNLKNWWYWNVTKLKDTPTVPIDYKSRPFGRIHPIETPESDSDYLARMAWQDAYVAEGRETAPPPDSVDPILEKFSPVMGIKKKKKKRKRHLTGVQLLRKRIKML